MKKHFDLLKAFDAYYKPVEDLQEKTPLGGLITIACWTTIFVLSSMRTYDFFLARPGTKETIYVDASKSPRINIDIDLIFPRISCDYLSLDALDSSGEQQLHIDHNIFKRRLDLNGSNIDEPIREEVAAKTETEIAKASTEAPKCGSCYGAEDPSRNITCCNTCEEVREAYRYKRWNIHEDKIEQCKSSGTAQQIQRAFKEGCRIYGNMEVNRVAGSFHVAPGPSFSMNHLHVHDVNPFSSSDFNTSHIIKHLSFGKNYESSMNTNPLDGTSCIASEGGKMYNYYIKIVPTLYENEGEIFETNQFSVTKYEKALAAMRAEAGMPGIFFNYELSALVVKVSVKPVPVSHFITDLCSIVGGIWVFSMFLDSVWYRYDKHFYKFQLDKSI